MKHILFLLLLTISFIFIISWGIIKMLWDADSKDVIKTCRLYGETVLNTIKRFK